jgi:EAL domain-containing protein (putative c-di-GMP-specific phosphodiesterase class I)
VTALLTSAMAACSRLKFDHTLIHQRAGERRIAAGLIELAHQLGFEVIASGVETTEQMSSLRRDGCDLVEGHAISHPVPATALTPWLLANAQQCPEGGQP